MLKGRLHAHELYLNSTGQAGTAQVVLPMASNEAVGGFVNVTELLLDQLSRRHVEPGANHTRRQTLRPGTLAAELTQGAHVLADERVLCRQMPIHQRRRSEQEAVLL